MVAITVLNKISCKSFTKYFLNEYWGIKYMKKIKKCKDLEVIGGMKKISKNDIISKR